jgi:hypothetical protein
MRPSYQATDLWLDVGELPELLQATLGQEQGFSDVAGLLRGRDVARIVTTGNGASYYVALTMPPCTCMLSKANKLSS